MSKLRESTAVQTQVRNRNSDPAARAVGRCRAAWQTTYDTYLREHSTGKEDRISLGFIRYEARKKAQEAYRDAMPSFSSRESIQGFIACVAYGVIFKAFSESLSTKAPPTPHRSPSRRSSLAHAETVLEGFKNRPRRKILTPPPPF